MRLVAFALISAVLAAFFQPTLLIYALLAEFSLIAFYYRHAWRQVFFNTILIIFINALGWWAANWQLQDYRHRILANPAKAEFVVQISELAASDAELGKFNATILAYNGADANLARLKKLRINWYFRDKKPEPALKRGQIWRVNLSLKPPHGMHNAAGFNFENWLLANNIHATGSIKTAQFLSAYNPKPSFSNSIYKIQNAIFDKLHKSAYSDGANLVAALVLGFKNAISQSEQQYFRDSGTAHLFAISGLHVGMVGALFWLLSRLVCAAIFMLGEYLKKPNFGRLIYKLKPQNIAIVSALIASFLYSLLAGWSLPTMRAFIMLAVFYVAVMLRLRAFSLNNLALALFILLLLIPSAVLGAGMWLSFVATFWVIVIINNLNYLPKFSQGSIMALIMPVVLYPLNLYFFEQSAILSSIANLILIPLIGSVVLPLALLAIVPISLLQHFVLAILDFIYKIIILSLDWLNNLPYFAVEHASINIWQLLSYELACYILILLLAKKFKIKLIYKILAAVLVVGCVYFIWQLQPRTKLAAGEFAVEMLDVGQGLSVIIYTQNHIAVYDTGASFKAKTGSGFVVAKVSLLPVLQQNKFASPKLAKHKIDSLIISHNDNDHSGGALDLLAHYPADKIYLSESLAGIDNFSFCSQGLNWTWDNVKFEFLAPNKKLLTGDSARNDKSCVLKISGKDYSFLLTGDISRKVENILLQTYRHKLKTDFLLVPHHGSRTSSSKDFLAAVAPRAALVSAGFYNRFHHPSWLVKKRYLDLKIPFYNSAECGMLRILPSHNLPLCTREQSTIRWQQQLKTQVNLNISASSRAD